MKVLSVALPPLQMGLSVGLGLAVAFSGANATEPPVTETIVLVRLEKSLLLDWGNSIAKGLIELLLFLASLVNNFGKPDVIVAPDTDKLKENFGAPKAGAPSGVELKWRRRR